MNLTDKVSQGSQKLFQASLLRGFNQAFGLLRELLIILLLNKEVLIIYFSVKALIEIPAIILSQNAIFSIPKKEHFKSYVRSFITYPDFILILFSLAYILTLILFGFTDIKGISLLLFSLASVLATVLNISFAKITGQIGIVKGSLYPLMLSVLTCTFYTLQYWLGFKGLDSVLISRIISQVVMIILLFSRFNIIVSFKSRYYPNILDIVQINLFIIFIAFSRYTIRFMSVDVGVVFNYLLFFISPALLLLINTSFQDKIISAEVLSISKRKKTIIVLLVYLMSFVSIFISRMSFEDSRSLLIYVSLLLMGIVIGIKRLERWSMLRF